ncbi:MAG: hypothetical protein WDO12_00580 [Pseudomonadota bacterium]
MNSEQEHAGTELDAQLAQLPQWQPPADFAARLAAAAARQAAEPVTATPPSTSALVWEGFVEYLPLALGVGVLALVLALLPWTQWAAAPVFPWAVAGAGLAGGLALTLRLLRVP